MKSKFYLYTTRFAGYPKRPKLHKNRVVTDASEVRVCWFIILKCDEENANAKVGVIVCYFVYALILLTYLCLCK